MIDVANKCYTRVKTAVNALIKGASQTYIDTPPDFPYMYFNQVDNPETASDLDGNENAVKPMTEITIYTMGDTKLTDAKKIMALADTQMKSMGYIRTFGPREVTNITNTNICRLLSRYSRVIGSGDVF
jgi:hypothetical protein